MSEIRHSISKIDKYEPEQKIIDTDERTPASEMSYSLIVKIVYCIESYDNSGCLC